MKSRHLLGCRVLLRSTPAYISIHRETAMQNNTSESSKEILVGCLLLLALAVTRSGITRSHFGTEINLPDASWAVFWLTGAFTHRRWWPALLMPACVAIDYFVIAGGVSAYCFTPAYPFLIPAYLSLWATGRWLQPGSRNIYALRAAASLVAGVSACFIISNIGFYLAAGYFAQMPAMLYAQTVARYWPYYLLHTSVYAGAGLVIAYIVHSRASLAEHAARVDP
jgi:hypothetical protein